MNILFHTIAVEPARWTPQRTSQELVSILPQIALAGFRRIEVFEPHLTDATISERIQDSFRAFDITPEILSSYLNLNPVVTSTGEVSSKVEQIRERIDYYGFRKVRIFPSPGTKPSDHPAIAQFTARLERLVARLPDTEILLETHDGSLADDPETIVQIVRDLKAPTVGLLYQPTLFEPESALRQFELQQPYIRHIHLQNRHPDLSFATLSEGVIPWSEILVKSAETVGASLEFVPLGICSADTFDLQSALRQARDEADYVRTILSRK